MLSRLATRALVAQPSAWIRPAARATSTTPVKQQAQESSERDLVNFPRRTRPIDRPNVRHHWIPEEFFQFFHAKTGVTGPYMFMGGLTTFLLSKEIWVIEHEFWVGIAIFIVWGGAIKMIGPGFTKNINEELAKDDARIKAIRQDEIDRCKNAIDNENNSQWMATSYEELMKAKKENVALQLEANYRQRLQDAYQQVKKRLDYQLEVSNVMRRAEQRHMVDWIISNVRKSITAKQEEDALKKCITDLKALAK